MLRKPSSRRTVSADSPQRSASLSQLTGFLCVFKVLRSFASRSVISIVISLSFNLYYKKEQEEGQPGNHGTTLGKGWEVLRSGKADPGSFLSSDGRLGVFGRISAAPGVMNLLKFFRELEMDIHPEFYQAVPVSASACKPERSDQAYF